MSRIGGAEPRSSGCAQPKANTIAAGGSGGLALPGYRGDGLLLGHDLEAEPLIKPGRRIAPGNRQMQFVHAIRIQARGSYSA